jgi:hypothetical protein
MLLDRDAPVTEVARVLVTETSHSVPQLFLFADIGGDAVNGAAGTVVAPEPNLHRYTAVRINTFLKRFIG